MAYLIDAVAIRNFLLGKASESEWEAMENGLATREELADHFDVAEDDLIAEFVRGELSRDDRELFQRAFLTSKRRRERLELIRELYRTTDTPPTVLELPGSPSPAKPSRSRNSGAWIAVLAASLALVLTAGFFFARWQRSEQSLALLWQAVEGLKKDARQTSISSPKSSFALIAVNTVRGPSSVGMQTFRLTPGSPSVHLELILPAAAAKLEGGFVVRLSEPSGVEVWSGVVTSADSPGALRIDLPSSALTPGEYSVTAQANGVLTGGVVTYEFRLEH